MKLIKYDFKENADFIRISSEILLALAFIGLVVSYVFPGLLALDSGLYSLLLGIIFLILLVVNMVYIRKISYASLKGDRAYLSMSLPMARSTFVRAKVFSGLIYLAITFSIGLFLVWVLGFRINSSIFYYALIGLLWLGIYRGGLIIGLARERRTGKRAAFVSLIIVLAIFVVGFFLLKYFSFAYVSGDFQRIAPRDFAFVYPFALGSQGLYPNLMSLLYYLLADFLLFLASIREVKNLEL